MNGTIFSLLYLAFIVFVLVGFGKVFQKAGKPGWGIIIPIYNAYLMIKIAGRPGWWLLLYLIPLVNIVVSLVVAIDTAKAFGRSSAFGVIALWLFSIVGFMILGYGNSKYIGPQQH